MLNGTFFFIHLQHMEAILLQAATIVITATATAISAAITRFFEKKHLRKKGLLCDKCEK